jgi:tRNA(Ile)-lysidine synthase
LFDATSDQRAKEKSSWLFFCLPFHPTAMNSNFFILFFTHVLNYIGKEATIKLLFHFWILHFVERLRMGNMLQRVLQTIQTYRMLSPGDKVVVGLSGGADSVALLHILKELQNGPLNINLYAAHVNHGIRGVHAREDAIFAHNLCKEWGIPFFLEEADIPSLARSMNQSEEEVGRQIRYGFFREVAEKVNGNKIATAHHKNDQAETILHNLIRGTGMQGLTGIQAVSDGVIIRPLLEITKQQILEYIALHELPYQEDATNEDSTYTRNRIRNQLIPSLEKDFNPDIVDSLVRMSGILREEEEFLADYTMDLYQKYTRSYLNKLILDLKSFSFCHLAI